MKNQKNLWITGILLGILFDLLFWEKAPGISVLIIIAVSILAGILLLKQEGYLPAKGSYTLILLVLFFSGMIVVRLEPMTTFLNYVFMFGIGLLMAVTYLGGRWYIYSIFDITWRILKLIGGMLYLPAKLLIDNRKQPGANRNWRSTLLPILRGALISIPILAVFIVLLASADPVFKAFIENLLRYFDLKRLAEYTFRGVYIVILAYLFCGLLLFAATHSDDRDITAESKPHLKPFLGITETGIIFGSVEVLFLIFAFIQFKYLFGGHANITQEGFTYAQYAQRGFGELIVVGFFSLLLLILLSSISYQDTDRKRKVFSILGAGLVALVLVILISAFQRLMLYEQAYSFTRARFYALVFMIWLGLLLIAVIALVLKQYQRGFGVAILAACIGFALSMNLLNVDATVVRHNINRAAGGADLDIYYLAAQLSDDAIPTIGAKFSDPALPNELHQDLGVTLICYQWFHEYRDRPEHWQSFNFSRWQAQRTFTSLADALADYQRIDKGYTMEVWTPDGDFVSCYGNEPPPARPPEPIPEEDGYEAFPPYPAP